MLYRSHSLNLSAGGVLLLMIAGAPAVRGQALPETLQRIAAVLDDFHRAASDADYDRYFGYLAPNAVFLGTDATERWDLEAFQAFARPVFDRGQGWTYKPTSRHIYVSSDGNTAWFDESLDNKTLGECRGSGVLTLHDSGWKIAQYNLTIPIPNALAREVVQRIKALEP